MLDTRTLRGPANKKERGLEAAAIGQQQQQPRPPKRQSEINVDNFEIWDCDFELIGACYFLELRVLFKYICPDLATS